MVERDGVRFMRGVLWGIAFSLPLWVAIVIVVRSLW